MRKRAGALIIAVLTAASLAVGVAGSAGASTGAKKAKAPLCAGKTKKQAIADITLAYQHFLDGTTYPDATADKAPFIQYLSGKKFSQEFLDKFVASSEANSAAAATTNVDVDEITCKSKKTAEVIFTLVISGGRLDGLAPPGGAVLEGKTWKVSGLTLCNTQALGDPTTLETEPCATIVLEELI